MTSSSNYYLDMAELISKRSTCLNEQYGAVIVNKDQILATAHNGIQISISLDYKSAELTCIDINTCKCNCSKECSIVPAEVNAILLCNPDRLQGTTLFLVGKRLSTGEYCYDSIGDSLTKRIIHRVGIFEVVVRLTKDTYKQFLVEDFQYIENQTIVNHDNETPMVPERTEFVRDRVIYINAYIGSMSPTNLVSLAFNKLPEPEEYVKALNDYFSAFGRTKVKIHHSKGKFYTQDDVEVNIAVAGESVYYLLKNKVGEIIEEGKE